jgi:hypothetical protein
MRQVVGILLGALYTPVWTSAIFTPADYYESGGEIVFE